MRKWLTVEGVLSVCEKTWSSVVILTRRDVGMDEMVRGRESSEVCGDLAGYLPGGGLPVR